jgi:hypothetical protein
MTFPKGINIKKKLHLTRIADASAAKLKFFMVGKILFKGSTRGAVIFNIICEIGLKKSA